MKCLSNVWAGWNHATFWWSELTSESWTLLHLSHWSDISLLFFTLHLLSSPPTPPPPTSSRRTVRDAHVLHGYTRFVALPLPFHLLMLFPCNVSSTTRKTLHGNINPEDHRQDLMWPQFNPCMVCVCAHTIHTRIMAVSRNSGVEILNERNIFVNKRNYAEKREGDNCAVLTGTDSTILCYTAFIWKWAVFKPWGML